jgi:H+/Cl- antiporter ClcA
MLILSMEALRKIKKILVSNYNDNLPYLLVGLLAGLVCCLYAILFNSLEKFAENLYAHNNIMPFFLCPLFMLIGFLLVSKFSPAAGGSGIPQVMTCIEPENKHRSQEFLGLKVILIKVLSSSAGILSGAAIGREGPSLQISASIGELVSRQAKKMNIMIKSEQLVIAGAASGLAAAFNTPIGGIIYAIEELSLEHIRSYKTVLILSVLIAGLVAQLLMGNYLYLGFPQIFSKIEIKALVTVSLVAFASGILGSMFSNFLTHLSKWRKLKTFKQQCLISISVGIVLASVFYFLGERNLFSGKESINFVLFNSKQIGVVETISRFIMPLISSMTGIAGGIFAPALSAGASFGGLMASLMNEPELKTLLGLSGMIGFLTGVTRTPITSFVLVQEMTDRHSAIFFMMLAAFLASLGASLLGTKSFYERAAEELKNS